MIFYISRKSYSIITTKNSLRAVFSFPEPSKYSCRFYLEIIPDIGKILRGYEESLVEEMEFWERGLF